MEPTTDLVLRSKPNGITTIWVPRAHRHPTPLDWERWAPTIKARYRSEPARVLIGEMNAEGLHITEKMFRDRLRLWHMNNKNRRSAAHQRPGALPSADNGDDISKPGSHYNKIGRNSSRFVMLGHENIPNVLQTPKEMLVLQRTLKGLLDWQQQAQDSTVNLDCCYTFHNLLVVLRQCLAVSDTAPSMCKTIVAQLRITSAKLQSHMVTSNPLAFLYCAGQYLFLALKRNTSPWYYETSRFLINAAVEAFPASHPSLLLLRLLLSNLTTSQLVMVYKVGSNVIEQFCGEAEGLDFLIGISCAAPRTGLDVTIRSHAKAPCAAKFDETDPGDLYDMARLCLSMRLYEEFADAVRRCLAQTENKSGKDSSISIVPLTLLSFVQAKQNDFVFQEMTLQKMLESALVRDRRELHTSQLSMVTLEVISKLDAIYAYRNLNEQRDALHLEYPSAFEL